MAEITIVNPHNEGRSEIEVAVNGEKWSIPRGKTVDVPDYVAEEVRRSLAQRESLSLSDRDEREGEPESGGSGGGGGESSGGVLICTEDESYALNHTWQEIHDADLTVVKREFSAEGYTGINTNYVIDAVTDGSLYYLTLDVTQETYTATSTDGYPVRVQG